ncbi:hypothetical protein [Clostridium tyrobutyricum]|uniref:hypothetical protein n=1 Tax=Clostridium tyrobutyricum TaxID=1519 RepID=UPI000580174F|nr:hypothetical protein [Clostridium tyrobutyricum]
MDIIKNFASIPAIAAFLFTANYFIVRLPLYESSNINKTEFSKDTVKGLTIVFIVCFILFIVYLIFSDKMKLLSCSYIFLSLGYMILYLYFYKKVENKRKSIVNAVNSYMSDKYSYGMYQVFSILIIFIIAFAVVKASFYMKQENISNIFLIRYIFLYLINMLLASYIMAYGKLFNFTKYLIFSKKFSDENIIGYLLFENDDEIIVKCDESYPIIFKKADIDTYMEMSI